MPTRLVHSVVDAVQPARLAPFAGDDQAAKVAALLAAGAGPADAGQGSVSRAVLAHPEGSVFCARSPR